MNARIRQSVAVLALALLTTVSGLAQGGNGKYAEVNGLKMYYEVHGSGRPLVILHGAFGTVEGWAPLVPALGKGRQLIIVELQAHGRTADRGKNFTWEQLADDVAALAKHLKLDKVDLFGYSMGGGVALGVAIRHPDLVSRLAILGASTGSLKDTYDAATFKQFSSITPDNFNFPQVKDPYDKVAPNPGNWKNLVLKVVDFGMKFPGFSDSQLKGIKAETLIIMGDRDVVTPEHAVKMMRQIPGSRLSILPGCDHFVPFMGPERLLEPLIPFLDGKHYVPMQIGG